MLTTFGGDIVVLPDGSAAETEDTRLKATAPNTNDMSYNNE